MKGKTSPLYFIIFGPPGSPPMEGGSAKQHWSGWEEAVFIDQILQAGDFTNRDYKSITQAVCINKPPVLMSIFTGGLCKEDASVKGLYTIGWVMPTASDNRPFTLAVVLWKPPV
jgi:hypothetical protein